MMIRPGIARPSWPTGGRGARPSFRSCPFSTPFASLPASAGHLLFVDLARAFVQFACRPSAPPASVSSERRLLNEVPGSGPS